MTKYLEMCAGARACMFVQTKKKPRRHYGRFEIETDRHIKWKLRTRINNAIMLNISEIRGVGFKLRRNHTFVFFWPGSGVIKTRIPLTCLYSTRGKHFSFHALRHIHIRYIVIFCKIR